MGINIALLDTAGPIDTAEDTADRNVISIMVLLVRYTITYSVHTHLYTYM